MANLDKDIRNLNKLINQEQRYLKEVAAAMLPLMSDRIFNRGQDSNKQPIGTYSDSYMKRRQKKGHGGSKKVIVTFTGQMVNDFSVVANSGEVGLGFKNKFNADKASFVEQRYNKTIFAHTKEEEKKAQDLFNKIVRRALR